ncbi:hypothetical protein [Kiloniella antarctica]|uniref:Uncharacterized protein n=1 Tax=Kiloniella antarctica TaxID=1550907 RepID=A0ABW5BI26_9PROT
MKASARETRTCLRAVIRPTPRLQQFILTVWQGDPQNELCVQGMTREMAFAVGVFN